MTVRALCATAALTGFISLASACAATSFQGDLDPCPEDNSTRDNLVGVGSVTATLAGDTLHIEGHFSGFSSPATAAHLNQGAAMGVPGPVLADLTLTHAASGDVLGQIKLSRAEIAALQKGALYVRLDSEKAPNGNSWAWLEEAP